MPPRHALGDSAGKAVCRTACITTSGKTPKKLTSTTEDTSSPGADTDTVSETQIEWEATPPPESVKRPLESPSSSDTLDDKDGSNQVSSKRICLDVESANGYRQLVTDGYKGAITDNVPGAPLPSVIVTGDHTMSAARYGPAPTTQRTLDTRYTHPASTTRVPDEPDFRPIPAITNEQYREFLLFLQSKNMGSVTPTMLGQSSGSVASDSASGGDLAPAVVGSVISSASGIDKPGAPTGTENNIICVGALPDIDETFDLALQDPMLVDHYPDLPNLWSETVLSWSSKVGPGYMLLSNWLQVIDYLPEDEVFMLFDFVQRGRYVNPARINPKLLQAVMPIYIKNKFRYTVCVGETPAILISTGIRPSPDTPSLRFVTMRPHVQEGERTVGCIAMVFNERKFHLQIDADVIIFGSLLYKPVSREQSNSKALAISGVPSPSSQLGTSRRTDDTGFKTVLGCDDDIPVYDGRHTPFDLNKDVENLAAVLPKYEGTEDGEVIPGSFIAVAYTATSYNNKDHSVAVSFNIQWVIVMGQPNDE
ncbi:hypothetical protein C8J57DRAFT_1576747 [Mycena rebaudengoi]|nr:hypothetical protein C8J57DRAFT_1576747 [Mycena rebaudengoi]